MNTEERILQYIEKEDLNENLQYIAELIGMESLKKIMQFAGGGHIYIPQPELYRVPALKKYLKENPEVNPNKLKREFGVCTKVILKVSRELNIPKNNPNQIRLPLDVC